MFRGSRAGRSELPSAWRPHPHLAILDPRVMEVDEVRARLYTLVARTRKVREAVEEMPPCEAQKLVPGHREPDRHLTNLELLLTEVADQLASLTLAQIKRSGGRSSRARGVCGGGGEHGRSNQRVFTTPAHPVPLHAPQAPNPKLLRPVPLHIAHGCGLPLGSITTVT